MKKLILLFSILTLFTNCQKEEQIQHSDLIGNWKLDYITHTEDGIITTDTITIDTYLEMTLNEGCYISPTDTVCHLYTTKPNTYFIQWDNGSTDIYGIDNDILTLLSITAAIETRGYFTRQ